MKKSDKTYLKTAAKDYTSRSVNPHVVRASTILFKSMQELRKHQKDIKNGIIISISTFEEKVGVAIGVTNDLVSKYDAVSLVKIASEILDGKGGGGRKDFAQAGGTNKNKIDDAFKAITNKIS